MPIQSVLAEGPAGSADVSELFVQATSSFTFSLRAWPASIAAVWIACPHVEVKTRSGIARSLVASLRAKAQLAASLHAAFVSAWPARQSDVAQAKVLLNQCCVHSTLTVHRRQCWLDSQFVKRCSMGFRDPFQYRTRSQIDKGWPDLHTGSREWNLKKIYKVKTSCLKLMLNIKELFDVRMDTVWLSQLYFQRYFSQNSFQANTAVVFVTACVHLACKANDQPRPLDNVIKKTYRLRYSRDPMESKKIDDIMVFVEYKVQSVLIKSCSSASYAAEMWVTYIAYNLLL